MTFILDISYGWWINDFDRDNAMIIEGHFVYRSILSHAIIFYMIFSHWKKKLENFLIKFVATVWYEIRVGCSHLYSQNKWLIISNESLVNMNNHASNSMSISRSIIKALNLAWLFMQEKSSKSDKVILWSIEDIMTTPSPVLFLYLDPSNHDFYGIGFAR